MTNSKKCTGCKTTKQLEEFYKNKLNIDGRSNYCIECTKSNSKKYFQRKKEKEIKKDLYPTLQHNNIDTFIKLLTIQKNCENILKEIDEMKKTFAMNESVLI